MRVTPAAAAFGLYVSSTYSNSKRSWIRARSCTRRSNGDSTAVRPVSRPRWPGRRGASRPGPVDLNWHARMTDSAAGRCLALASASRRGSGVPCTPAQRRPVPGRRPQRGPKTAAATSRPLTATWPAGRAVGRHCGRSSSLSTSTVALYQRRCATAPGGPQLGWPAVTEAAPRLRWARPASAAKTQDAAEPTMPRIPGTRACDGRRSDARWLRTPTVPFELVLLPISTAL